MKLWVAIVVAASVGCAAAEPDLSPQGVGGNDGIGGVDTVGVGGAPAPEGTGGAPAGTGGAFAGVGGHLAGTGGSPAVQGTGGVSVSGTGGTTLASGTGGSACSTSEGQPCGPCGGRVQCDGSCSVTTPANYGLPCGECSGTITCSGSCSVPNPAPAGDMVVKTFAVSPGGAVTSASVGGPCGVGYERLEAIVIVSGSGSYPQRGTCSATWVGADPASCTASVQITPGTTLAFSCQVTVRRTGVCP